MASKSFGNSLKRLFSTNVIVRKSPDSKGIKVVDSSKLQAYNQDYFRDRFSRIHKSSLVGFNRNQQMGYGAMRQQLYSDYETMDQDPILASALDIYADESTTRDENGDILKIKTPDDGIREVLDNLFYDIINVDFNLWPWIRNLCKYGDFYLHLHISKKYGIINVTPLPAEAIDRVEDSDPDNPYYVKFIDRHDRQKEYENYEMAHFRLLSDQNFVPYGKSMLENGRRIHKQLQLMEDAMLIHRIMRAPSKRVFKIDIGNIPPNEVENYMKQIINKMKKEPHINRKTGEYNLRYNIQNMTEDFYLPVRGRNNNTEIQELGGLQYDGTDDIEYLKNKLLAALKIPKSYLGYEDSLNGKATLAQEDIRFARTIERIQRIVEGELNKIAIIHLFAQGYEDEDLVNFSISLNNPSTIYTREQIEILSSKLNLVRDIKEQNLLSENWMYEHIFDMTEDEREEQRNNLLKDMWRRNRFESIERQGEDPMLKDDDEEASDNNSDGNDDFNFMNANKSGSDDYDQGDFDKEDFYGFGKEGGRPKDTSRYEKDDHPMGRDPIGKKGRNEGVSISLLDKLGLNDLDIHNNNNKGGKQLDLLSEDNILKDNN